MISTLPEDYWKKIDTILLHPEINKCQKIRVECLKEVSDTYDTLHIEIAGDIARFVLGGPGNWDKPARLFFKHNSIVAEGISGIQMPTSKRLILWMEDRASRELTKTIDDELAAQLLLLFVVSRLPNWLPLIESKQAILYSSFLEVCLRRGCMESWRRIAFYVTANRDINEHSYLTNLWNQMVISADTERHAEYYKMYKAVDLARFSPTETVADHKRVINDCEAIASKLDSLHNSEPTSSATEEGSLDQMSFEVLSIRCQMEIAYRLRLLDENSKAAEKFDFIINCGLKRLESTEETHPDFRAEILSAISEAMNIAAEVNFNFEEHNRLRLIHESVSLCRDTCWELARNAVNRGSNDFVQQLFDDAGRQFTEAFFRFWHLHSLSNMDRLHGFRGRLDLARCTNGTSPTKITELAFKAALAGAIACDQKLVIEARRILESSGASPTKTECDVLKNMVFDGNLLRRREKIGICFLATEFIDYFEECDIDNLIKLAANWSREPWDLSTTRDVARNAIRLLKATCRVLSGLDDPSVSAIKVAEALRGAVLVYPRVGHILLEVADVADAMAEIPREITKGASRVLLEILLDYHWEPGTIGEWAWTSIIRPAVIHSVLDGDTDLSTKISSKLPPISIRNQDGSDVSDPEGLGQTNLVEHAIQYRMFLGIHVDEEILSKYVNQKTERYVKDYLSEKPLQSFPGQFHPYIACVKQLKERDQKKVLNTLLCILILKELMPVVRSEALSALRWYVEVASSERQNKSERFSMLTDLVPSLVETLWKELSEGLEIDWSQDPFSGAAFQSFPLDVASFLLAGCESGALAFQRIGSPSQILSECVVEWLIKGSLKNREVASNFQAYQFGKATDSSKFDDLELIFIESLVKEKDELIRQQLFAGLAAGISRRGKSLPDKMISSIVIDCCIADSKSSHRGMAQKATNALVAILSTSKNGDDKFVEGIRTRVNEMRQGSLWPRALVCTADMLFTEEKDEVAPSSDD
ncbi:MAG: hypothetical protein GQ565_08090 [Candidatus Aegiribacteria sp.]|nr:hypothetical protein [Candidatus Aegiribacteria sp.]